MPTGPRRRQSALAGAPATMIFIGLAVVFFLLGLVGMRGDLIEMFAQINIRIEDGEWWRIFTVVLLHGSLTHIIFNMWALYVLGPQIERGVGTWPFVTLFLASAGVGGAFAFYFGNLSDIAVGASGAIFGLLMAYALYFPTRMFLVFFIFPVQARYFVMILGGLSLLFSLGGGSGVAHTAHLGGLVSGYLYLKGKRLNIISEIQYRYLKWRINRMRKKFDVYSGGRRDDYDRRVH